MANPFKFQAVEWYSSWPDGTYNRIVASGATLKGCLNRYRKHIDTFRLAGVDHKPVKTVFLCDGVAFDVAL